MFTSLNINSHSCIVDINFLPLNGKKGKAKKVEIFLLK